MPQIAIAACRKVDDYTQAVLNAGGAVHIVDSSMSVAAALAPADGLLLTGGDDVAPARYGEQRHPAVREVAPERDAFEIDLIREARARGLPIFAICRGLQVLNVSAGGTLVQDIPSQLARALEHRRAVPPHESVEMAHTIQVEKPSLLATLLGGRLDGAGACEVNSRHHQSVNDVAPGFRVTAKAPDGVVEAMEDPAARFCLGVQWHPENFHATGEFSSLFEGFVNAARRTSRPSS